MVNSCVTCGVYTAIFCCFASGIIYPAQEIVFRLVVEGRTYSSETSYCIAQGVIYVFLGILLLVGVLKRRAVLVATYLVICFVGLTLGTIGAVYFTVMRKANAVLIVVFVVYWVTQYAVYLFYKDLVGNQQYKTAGRRVEETLSEQEEPLKTEE